METAIPPDEEPLTAGSKSGHVAHDAHSQGLNDGWQDPDWEMLLDSIDQRRVIPILGRDLLLMNSPESDRLLLHDFLAKRLIDQLLKSQPKTRIGDPSDYTLSDAVYLCLKYGGQTLNRIHHVRFAIMEILKEVMAWDDPVPPSLRKLSQITDLDLYVSTTFDSLMQRALETSPGATRRIPSVLTFDPQIKGPIEDLPLPTDTDRSTGSNGAASTPKASVYHLMGKLTRSSSNVVISDEDLLEYVCALISGDSTRIPIHLLNRFADSDLLLLGCRFSDWLARFFVRAAKRGRVSARHNSTVEYVVDDFAPQDGNLVMFVNQFWSHNVRIYRTTNVLGWVDELHRRWCERNPDKANAVNAVTGVTAPRALDPSMPEHSIFISYAREDELAVERIHAELNGLPVWYDRQRLEAGDGWERKIEEHINKCRIFMPVISKNTDARLKGFFRKEWYLAAQLSHQMHPEYRFICPVIIDDTKPHTARVPKEFLSAHWQTATGGQIGATFKQQLSDILNSPGTP